MRSCRNAIIVSTLAGLGMAYEWFAVASGAVPVIQPQAVLTVFDAHGKQVSQVVGVEAGHGGPALIYVVVRLTVGAHTFVRSAHRDRLVGNTSAPIFESDHCSGQPFLVRPAPDAILPAVAIVGPRATVYLAAPEAIPQTIIARSHLALDGSCMGGIEAHVSGRLPAIKFVELAADFSPPFHVR